MTKVEAVQEFRRPQTKKDIRAFLGLAGYYRRFIPAFSSTAACLSDLTKAMAPTVVDWTAECEDAFMSLKNVLVGPPVLASPDYGRQFLLQTDVDASERSLGGVLSQKNEEGVERAVAYFPRKLLSRETRYSAIEKECLAIVTALQHFEPYLLGRTFSIQTDHRALSYIENMRNNNSRLMRWALALQPFNFTITWIAEC